MTTQARRSRRFGTVGVRRTGFEDRGETKAAAAPKGFARRSRRTDPDAEPPTLRPTRVHLGAATARVLSSSQPANFGESLPLPLDTIRLGRSGKKVGGLRNGPVRGAVGSTDPHPRARAQSQASGSSAPRGRPRPHLPKRTSRRSLPGFPEGSARGPARGHSPPSPGHRRPWRLGRSPSPRLGRRCRCRCVGRRCGCSVVRRWRPTAGRRRWW